MPRHQENVRSTGSSTGAGSSARASSQSQPVINSKLISSRTLMSVPEDTEMGISCSAHTNQWTTVGSKEKSTRSSQTQSRSQDRAAAQMSREFNKMSLGRPNRIMDPSDAPGATRVGVRGKVRRRASTACSVGSVCQRINTLVCKFSNLTRRD
jgi:hypothetical protein